MRIQPSTMYPLIESYATKKYHPEDLWRGSVLMLFWREELEQTRNPPSSCWQGGGAAIQSLLSPTTPPSWSVSRVCRIIFPVSQNQPTIQKVGKTIIVKKYYRKIVIIHHRESCSSSPIVVPPPHFAAHSPFASFAPYLTLHTYPILTPRLICPPKTALSLLPCHGDLVHRLLCSTTNKIYHVHRENSVKVR